MKLSLDEILACFKYVDSNKFFTQDRDKLISRFSRPYIIGGGEYHKPKNETTELFAGSLHYGKVPCSGNRLNLTYLTYLEVKCHLSILSYYQ